MAPPEYEVDMPIVEEKKPINPISQIDINGDRYSFIDTVARYAIDRAKPVYATFTIPTSGWSSDSTGGYPNYQDFTVSGLTTADRVDVVIAASSVNIAAACGMCPTTETLTDKFRIRTSVIPSADITAQYQITRGD